MFPKNVDTFVSIVNILGILAFAFSGAVAGMKREADVVGVLLLSLVACSFGGLVRDLLIGDLPPELLRGNFMLILAAGPGLFTFFFYKLVDKLHRPIDFFDALGLGLFVVVGANKAMAFGITPAWCVGLGLLTGVGGGVARDMMLAQVPTIFKSEIYATPAFLGSFILVAGQSAFPSYGELFMALGAIVCTGLRLLAIHYSWHVRR
ncbi:MAG: TRIC cation channel family protein [Candidatus Adiutrix sp.]|jgi:uncharacterized membrane protein YeiH|nr:TRIC cation channel family protein [Candidatus Adiutrix sp.]